MQKLSGARCGLWMAAAFALWCGMAPAAGQSFTDWGWPQPYARVSDKSIAWLKQKGWWPLAVGWQGPFSGQNTINVVMDKAGLLEKRGLDAKFQVFAAGPDVNEAIAAARIQVGNGGNFPFTSLLDRGIPVRAIAVVAPNLKHSTVVPLDSPVKSLADLKGSNPPATIGIVTGSSAEFYFTQAAEVVGLQIGKDVILKNMPPGEQLLMVKGIGAVVPWEPSVTIITDDRKTGREVDTIFPYNLYEGMFYVRQELIDNVPDVVQAISDAFMEATLWIRLNPDQAADFLAAEPMLKVYGKPLLLQQVRTLQQPVQADRQLSVRQDVGRGKRPHREMAEGPQPSHQGADREGLRKFLRCQLHGEYLSEARLGHPGAGAVPSKGLAGKNRRASLSALCQRHHLEGSAAVAGKGRSNQGLVLQWQDLPALMATPWRCRPWPSSPARCRRPAIGGGCGFGQRFRCFRTSPPWSSC